MDADDFDVFYSVGFFRFILFLPLGIVIDTSDGDSGIHVHVYRVCLCIFPVVEKDPPCSRNIRKNAYTIPMEQHACSCVRASMDESDTDHRNSDEPTYHTSSENP